MNLSVAIQMDPVAAIDIRGDSSFALGLERKSVDISYGATPLTCCPLLRVRFRQQSISTTGFCRRHWFASTCILYMFSSSMIVPALPTHGVGLS